MKIKQKLWTMWLLPVGLSKGNGIWDGIGISFGKIRHLRQEIWSLVHFDHGCDRDGLPQWFRHWRRQAVHQSRLFRGDGTAASAGWSQEFWSSFLSFRLTVQSRKIDFPKIETKDDSRRIFKILHLHDHGSDGLFVDRSSGTWFESVGAFDGYADRACFGRVLIWGLWWWSMPDSSNWLWKNSFSRGFLMRRFEKYGKGFAVIVSAVLFGVMHGNPLQIVMNAVGLILGYIAIEYSIKWSIILHIANNFILGDVIGGCSGCFPMMWKGLRLLYF